MEARPLASLFTVVVVIEPPPDVTAKVTWRPGMALPRRSSIRTRNEFASCCWIVPDCAFPETTTGERGACATVTRTRAVRDWNVAEIVEIPSASAVMTPEGETVTTPDALDDQTSPAADIGAPRWSSTTAASGCVAPMASSVSASGVSCTDVALGGSVVLVHEPTTITASVTVSSVDSDGRKRIRSNPAMGDERGPAGGTAVQLGELRS